MMSLYHLEKSYQGLTLVRQQFKVSDLMKGVFHGDF